jgi:hypothetical protein
MRNIDFLKLVTKETPKEILEADFPRLAPLPISGGWGYDQSCACIITNPHCGVDPSAQFDWAGLEYIFAEYRLYEELIIFRPEGQKYSGIDFQLSSQSTIVLERRRYDVLKFSITAFLNKDFERLRAAYEGPSGAANPDFDHVAHAALHNSLCCSGEREYWFDVTSV